MSEEYQQGQSAARLPLPRGKEEAPSSETVAEGRSGRRQAAEGRASRREQREQREQCEQVESTRTANAVSLFPHTPLLFDPFGSALKSPILFYSVVSIVCATNTSMNESTH